MFHSLDEDEDHEGVEDDIDEEIDGDGFDVEGAIPAAFEEEGSEWQLSQR